MIKNNLFKKGHPYLRETEQLLLETWSIGVLNTDGERFVGGGLVLIGMQILLFPLCLLVNIPKVLILAVVWGCVQYFDVDLRNMDAVYLVIAALALYYKDVKSFLSELCYVVLIVFSGGLIVKWVAKGYLTSRPFRQSILENEENAKLITGISGFLERKYLRKYDRILDLYLSSNTEIGEKTFLKETDLIRKENLADVRSLGFV